MTASGQQAREGIVASNELALGTRILLDYAVFGRREFIVEDRIGSGSQLDIFNGSEAACLQYGRRTLGFRVIERT